MEKLSKNIDINMNYLSKLLCINKSFDLITRVIELKGHKTAIYCIDGFVKSDTLEKLLEFMFKKTDSFKQPEDFPTDASSFLTLLLPYCETGSKLCICRHIAIKGNEPSYYRWL